MSEHELAVLRSVEKLEEIVSNLETELRRREADLKVMRLMAAQCRTAKERDDNE